MIIFSLRLTQFHGIWIISEKMLKLDPRGSSLFKVTLWTEIVQHLLNQFLLHRIVQLVPVLKFEEINSFKRLLTTGKSCGRRTGTCRNFAPCRHDRYT